MKTCVQCGHEVNDKFCSNCGQKSDIKRLTFKFFIHDFLDRIYGLDGAFPRTVIGMTVRPGKLVREYLSGVRRKYVGPVGFYFLMWAIFFLIAEIFDISIDDYFQPERINDSINDATGVENTATQKEITKKIQSTVFENIQYFTILVIPFLAWWGRILFRKSGINNLEGMVANFYILGNSTIINIFGFLLFIFAGASHMTITMVLGFAYYVWALSLIYAQKVSFMSILKSLGIYILAFASFMIAIMILSIPIGIIFALFEK